MVKSKEVDEDTRRIGLKIENGNYSRLDVPTEIRKDGELARSQEDVCQTIETRSSAKRKKAEKEEVESSLELGKEISTDVWMEEQRKDPALDDLRNRVGNDMSKEVETLITLEKENMNDSITGGLGDNSRSSEGLTLQLRFYRTTFDIAFTCVTFTVAFFGFVGNLVTIEQTTSNCNSGVFVFAHNMDF
uniref:Uncharacterized protein n=1 Tax=Magallana gigas TaxID=29159 RepID=A0A8W8LIR4_MAGGI